MAISANAYTVQILESINKRIQKMSPEEKNMFSLDDTLGGTSTVLHQKALHRLYGDKTDELVEGLKRNPVVAVPIILKRLKVKEEEWREREEKFNSVWRHQMDQYYLKSLDQRGINFKQNDSKSFRPKSLLADMDMVYVESKENKSFDDAHFVLEFQEMDVFKDAINLMLQYLKKLPGVYRDDRRRIELVVRSFVPDFFGAPRATLPDSEMEVEEEAREPTESAAEGESAAGPEERSGPPSPACSLPREEALSEADDSNASNEENESSDEAGKSYVEDMDVFDKIEPLPTTNMPYTMFFVNRTWFVFFRQFHILCERLARLLFESTRQDLTLKREEEDEEVTVIPDSRHRPTYDELIAKLSRLLSGAMDYSQFEEEARSMFGIYAYVSFTMDKLVLNIVRQLQQVITDDMCKQVTALFIAHARSVAADGCSSAVESSRLDHDYLRRVQRTMDDDRTFKVVWHKKGAVLTIQLMEQEAEEHLPDPHEAERWSDYLDAYVTEDACCEEMLTDEHQSPVLLGRNLRRQQAFWKGRAAQLLKQHEAREAAKNSSGGRKALALSARRRRALVLVLRKRRSSRHEEEEEDGGESGAEAAGDPGSGGNAADHEMAPLEEEGSSENTSPQVESDPLSFSVKSESSDIEREPSPENTSTIEVLPQLPPEAPPTEEVIIIEEQLPEPDEVVMTSLQPDDDDITPDDVTIEVESSAPTAEEEEQVKTDPADDAVREEEEEEEAADEDDGKGSDAPGLPDSKEADSQEMDLTSHIDRAVETATRVIETIAEEVEEVKAEVEVEVEEAQEVEAVEVPVEEEDSEPDPKRLKRSGSETSITDTPSRSGNGESGTRRATTRKCVEAAAASSRTRKTRYRAGPCLRDRGGAPCSTKGPSSTPSSKARRARRRVPWFVECLEDPTFDFAAFAELPEGERAALLSLRHVTVRDEVEGAFRKGSYKIYFVQDCDLYVYRRSALGRAREVHRSSSEIKTSNFNAWHRVWLDRYVTPAMVRSCEEWLLRSDPERFQLQRVTVSECVRPPYIPYHRYRVRYYRTDA